MPHREYLLASVVTSSLSSPAVRSICSVGATSFSTYKCQLNHMNVYCRNDNLNGDNRGHNGDES